MLFDSSTIFGLKPCCDCYNLYKYVIKNESNSKITITLFTHQLDSIYTISPGEKVTIFDIFHSSRCTDGRHRYVTEKFDLDSMDVKNIDTILSNRDFLKDDN